MSKRLRLVSLDALNGMVVEPQVCPELSRAFQCPKPSKDCERCLLSPEFIAELKMLIATRTVQESGQSTNHN
jgi:hypothetical protein